MSLSRRLREAADEAASNPNIAGGARRGQAKTAREPSPPRTQAQIDAMVRRPRGGKDKDEMDDEREEQRDEQQKKKRGGEASVMSESDDEKGSSGEEGGDVAQDADSEPNDEVGMAEEAKGEREGERGSDGEGDSDGDDSVLNPLAKARKASRKRKSFGAMCRCRVYF